MTIVKKLIFQKTVIEEVKANEAMGVKNAVAGDAKYDSPGREAPNNTTSGHFLSWFCSNV